MGKFGTIWDLELSRRKQIKPQRKEVNSSTSGVNSRREDDGHCVIQHALSKQQRVQVAVHMQLVEDGQHSHCTAENQHKRQLLILHLQATRCVRKALRQSPTGIRGGDDGAKEQAVGVVELVAQLSDHLHQFHHAVHKIPGGGATGKQVSKRFSEHEATLENRRPAGHSPDDKTGEGGAKEGIGEDGAKVPEEVSLQVRQTNKVIRLIFQTTSILWVSRFTFACHILESYETQFSQQTPTTGYNKSREQLLQQLLLT